MLIFTLSYFFLCCNIFCIYLKFILWKWFWIFLPAIVPTSCNCTNFQSFNCCWCIGHITINVLIVIDVGVLSIPIISTILFMTNVPSLQLSNRAWMLITLLEFSWTNLTGTTLILITGEPNSLMHKLNLYDSLIHSDFLTFLQHSTLLTFFESCRFSKPVHAVLLHACHCTPYKHFRWCSF